jgi:hypothetical protein
VKTTTDVEIITDGFCEVYINGTLQRTVQGSSVRLSIPLLTTIAVRALHTNSSTTAGFQMISSDGLMTGSHWKCSNWDQTDWKTIAFDDFVSEFADSVSDGIGNYSIWPAGDNRSPTSQCHVYCRAPAGM